ncbi:hypothetical protein HNP98_003470 [Hymenobacter sp. 9A]|uniref:Uncharacterized protein n=1 Tax=Hymenobacter caeli TaxID=2735894 RepID=A0ABX2FTV6_9BACT|nr:hypothetical protein [Hymenobacter caeli]
MGEQAEAPRMLLFIFLTFLLFPVKDEVLFLPGPAGAAAGWVSGGRMVR